MGLCYNAKNTEMESFTLYMNEATNHKVLSNEEEIELFEKYNESTGKAKDAIKNKIVESNLKLVVSIAKKYLGLGMEIEDLVSEGNIGLINAVDKFDLDSGNRFSTYAVWWIKQQIQRAITDTARTIRIPVHAYEKIQKIRKFEYFYEKKYDQKPTLDEICKETGYSKEQVLDLKNKAQTVLSLDAEIVNSENRKDTRTSLKDYINEVDQTNIEDSYIEQNMQELVLGMLDCLKDREYEIISLRFGIADNKPRTLEEIGKIYGISRERVRQIEYKALRRLRGLATKQGLKEYI